MNILLACSHPWPYPHRDDASKPFQPLVNLLAKGLSMNSDCGHDEAQFQWYQLDSRVKLLRTLVAKWLERWKTCSASLRTAFMFGHKLKSDHGWIAVCTNEWCYKYIHMQISVLVVGQMRSKFRHAPTLAFRYWIEKSKGAKIIAEWQWWLK